MFPKESKLLMKEIETYFMFVAQDQKKIVFLCVDSNRCSVQSFSY